VIGSIRVSAVREDWRASLAVLVPVGFGVVLGIGVLSNVLKHLLVRYERGTHCVLLGLLFGSVLGLWPFQEARHPELVTKPGVEAVLQLQSGERTLAEICAATGIELTEDEATALRRDYAGLGKGELKLLGLQLERYSPSPARVGIVLLLLVGGFLVTRRLGAPGATDDD